MKTFIKVFVASVFIFSLAACSGSAKACKQKTLTSKEEQDYRNFAQEMGSDASFNLNFELLGIQSNIDGNSTRGITICPEDLTNQMGAKTEVSDGVKTYPVVYQKINDYEYKLGIKSGDETFFYSR